MIRENIRSCSIHTKNIGPIFSKDIRFFRRPTHSENCQDVQDKLATLAKSFVYKRENLKTSPGNVILRRSIMGIQRFVFVRAQLFSTDVQISRFIWWIGKIFVRTVLCYDHSKLRDTWNLPLGMTQFVNVCHLHKKITYS